MSENVKISNIEISNSKKLTVIAGLNVLENDELTFEVANKLKNVGALFPPIIGYFASLAGANTNEYLVFDTNWTSDTPIRFIS